jgi:hypothetical protein
LNPRGPEGPQALERALAPQGLRIIHSAYGMVSHDLTVIPANCPGTLGLAHLVCSALRFLLLTSAMLAFL